MSFRLLILFLVFAFSASVFGQKESNKISVQITDVYFCDLIEKPAEYAGKTIRIKATYESAVEISKLFCQDCLDVTASRVEFSGSFEKNTKKNLRKKLKNKAISNVIFIGKFSTGEFGKNKEYSSQFVVESADYVENLADQPGNLTIRMQAKTFCQKNG